MTKFRRRNKLIRPGLQLRLTAAFVGMTALGLMLQAFVFVNELTGLAAQLPTDGALVLARLQSTVNTVLLISLAVLLPITAWVGVLATHRIAGPVYRFEMYLRAVIRGEKPQDCKLRKGDELMELCATINEATAPLRGLAPGAAARGADASKGGATERGGLAGPPGTREAA